MSARARTNPGNTALDLDLRAQAAERYEAPGRSLRDDVLSRIAIESPAPAPRATRLRLRFIAPVAAAALLAFGVGLGAALWSARPMTGAGDPAQQAQALRQAVSLFEEERLVDWRERSMRIIRETANAAPVQREARALLSDSSKIARSMLDSLRRPLMETR